MTESYDPHERALPKLCTRAPDSHKGNFGRVLLVGGSRGMAGAIAISALAALRSGAGTVSVAVPDRCLETVASFHPCAMTIPLPEDPDGKISYDAIHSIREHAARSDAVALGPGLGRSQELEQLVSELYNQCPCPMVIDADALNNLSALADWQAIAPVGPRVLTPHPGEAERLWNRRAKDRLLQIEKVIETAKRLNLTIVLKGFESLITNGSVRVRNRSGTPAMATGGMGDCLTGMIAALMGQGLSALDAAHLGTYVHGKAAEMAHQDLGGLSVLATDVIVRLAPVFSSLVAGESATE